MKRTLFLLTLALLYSGCKNSYKFTISGIIKDPQKEYIYLSRLEVDSPIFIDSAKINRKGVFRFKVKSKEADFYQLGFASTNFITLLAEPGEKINLSFSGNKLFENYKITGSTGTQKLQGLDQVLSDTKRKLDSLSILYKNATVEPGFEVRAPQIETEYNELIKAQRKNNIEFIINNINSLASIKALYQRITPDAYVLYDQHDLQYLKIVRDSLSRHYPNSKHVKALAHDFEKEMNQLFASQVQQMASNLKSIQLDPDLKNISGNKVALSSLKGKYVLLTFWSAQSKECVEENLQLKEYYKLFNKKGFEIYQINLDQDESLWKEAVRFDELPWINTREEEPGNPKYATLYNVKSLPANYLYDKEGNIIASNIHGRTLHLKLNQLFNK